MKTVLLQYPDAATIEKIVDDVTLIKKFGYGNTTLIPQNIEIDMNDATQQQAVETRLIQRGIQMEAYTPGGNLPAGTAAIINGGTVPVRNSASADSHNATAAVTGNTLSGVNLASTVSMVDNTDVVTVLPATGTTPAQGTATAAVASGVLTGVRLPATSAVVTNGRTIAVTGGTVTLTVTNNVVTAAFTAA